jgi:hypothetical protein
MIGARITSAENSIGIALEGYGDFGSAPGHGEPIFIEQNNGRITVYLWADINQADPTHMIHLDGAREEQAPKYEEWYTVPAGGQCCARTRVNTKPCGAPTAVRRGVFAYCEVHAQLRGWRGEAESAHPKKRTAQKRGICAECRFHIEHGETEIVARSGARFHFGCWDNTVEPKRCAEVR